MGARDLRHRLLGEGLRIEADDSGLIVGPANLLTDEIRAAIRSHRQELLRLVRDDVAADAVQAEPASPASVADADPDERVRCTACRHHRALAFRCSNYRGAGLTHPNIAPALAELPQHCPGFAADVSRRRGGGE